MCDAHIDRSSIIVLAKIQHHTTALCNGRDVYPWVQVNGRAVCIARALCVSVLTSAERGGVGETWMSPTRRMLSCNSAFGTLRLRAQRSNFWCVSGLPRAHTTKPGACFCNRGPAHHASLVSLDTVAAIACGSGVGWCATPQPPTLLPTQPPNAVSHQSSTQDTSNISKKCCRWPPVFN